MKTRLAGASIEIRRSTISGYGVFASKNFRKDDIIEECPFVLLKNLSPELINYEFIYEDKKLQKFSAIPFGYGCLYNHAELPNAMWEFDNDNQIITFKALKNIQAGNEILTYYAPSWFSVRNMEIKAPYSLKNFAILLSRLIFILILFFIIKLALSSFPESQQKNSKYLVTQDMNNKKSQQESKG